MRRPSRNPWLALAVIGGVAYPVLVYFGLSHLPPVVLVMFGLALIGLRLLGARHVSLSGTRPTVVALAAAGSGLAGLLFLAPHAAALAYPIVISLATATVFGMSLIWPPSVVERIVRVREPDLSPHGVAYARKVTIVWTVFLVLNAAISAAYMLWGTLEQWTLWNGLVSYVMMGILFVVEIGVRRIVRRREVA
jgi:uncharacterized membrane protein